MSLRLALPLGLALAAACIGGEAAAPPPAPVVGAWIQMYPRVGALDTLVLDATGRIGRLTAGIDDIGVPLTHWRIGSPYSPGGLCLAADSVAATPRAQICQAFLVRGDTLWLANGVQAAFLRTGAGRPPQTAPWDRLYGHAEGTDPLTIGRDSLAARGH